LALQFLAEGLGNGGAGLAVLSTMTAKEMRERLVRLGLNLQPCEAKGRLKIIDWYSHKSMAIIGMEERGNILVPSKDIANLDIAFTGALESLAFAPTIRAVVDMITPALNIYELADVTEFVQRQKSRFREKGIASIFIVEDGAHDERVISTLKHMADGVISLSADDTGRMSLRIESMRLAKFKTGKIAVQLSSKGLTVIDRALDEVSAISELCKIPLVTKEIAQRLMDAGFTDLQKLSQAEQEELMKVTLVNRDVVKSIADYTRTIEYSHNVLSSRSEKWFTKAREQVEAGDSRKALKSLERALEIDSSNAAAQSLLAEIRKKLGLQE
jgi:KaiC/GvpD/RAD55 family RecA-like ATPase